MIVENIQTVFDTNRSPLQPNYMKLSIEEFDLYAFTVYTFMDLFWKSFNIESNRITKKFRFWIQLHVVDEDVTDENDYWRSGDSSQFGNRQLSRIEQFFIALNWYFKIYDIKTLQTIDYKIRENNVALDRSDFWNADVKFHPYKGMREDLRYCINWLEIDTLKHASIHNDVLHVLKQLSFKLSR